MTLTNLVPEQGERIALFTGMGPWFGIASIGSDLHWESFLDARAPMSRASFGCYRLLPQERTRLEESFDTCRSFPPEFESGHARLELRFLQDGDVKTPLIPVGTGSAASDAAAEFWRVCRELVAAAALKADAAHTSLCFNTEDFGGCTLRDGESLMISRPVSGPDQHERFRVVDLRDSGANSEHFEALMRGVSPVESAPTRAGLGQRASHSQRRPCGVFALRAGQQVRVWARDQNPQAFDDVFVQVRSRSEGWAKLGAVTDSIRRSRSQATAARSGIRPAVALESLVTDKPSRITTARAVPSRQQLESRLGLPYVLDGSFASLWAVERVLTALRRAPKLAEQAGWIAPSLAQVFGRAFSEMGAEITWNGVSSLRAVFPEAIYAIDTAEDVRRLLHPSEPFPSFYGLYWRGLEGFGPARTPWYGLATIFQNHAWAQTDHGPIGTQRTRMDRAVRWLVDEQVASLGLRADDLVLARKVARAMVWPPLGYPMNERGERNLPRLREVLADADANEARTVLDAFVGMQDRAFQLLAAATSIHFAIPPDNRHEALVYRNARQFFRIRDVPPFIKDACRRLAADLETPLRGRTHAAYDEVFNASPEEGVRMAAKILAKEPNLPVFQCMAGRHHERLAHDAQSMRHYSRAIELKPDYVQARINRGCLLARRGDFDLSDSDFLAARNNRPEDEDLRNNLLLNFFFAKAAQPPRND